MDRPWRRPATTPAGRLIRPAVRPLPLLAGALLAASVAGCATGFPPAGAHAPDMMGGGGMMDDAGSIVGGSTVSPAAADRLGRSTPLDAVVDRRSDTVTFTGPTVELTVLAAPSDGPDETFRVAGLTNPTIVIPVGAHVTLQLINADPGMEHDWLLSTARPPFASMGMMMIPVAMGAGTATLPGSTSTAMAATTIEWDASSPGRYTYLCSVPGHAAEGMYGSLIVGVAD